MSLEDRQAIDLLTFAIAPRLPGVLDVADPLSPLAALDTRIFRAVANPGEALRLVHRHQPRLLMVWVERMDLMPATALIDALRRRRPELPLLAITPETNPDVERAVRAAGAGYYFALDGDPDPPLLRQTLAALGALNARFSPTERPPPKTGPSRIRGRPPAVYRSP